MVDGKKVRSLRESKGMTQIELADKVGVSNKLVSYLEQGFKQPSAVVLGRIAKLLEVKMEDLMKSG